MRVDFRLSEELKELLMAVDIYQRVEVSRRGSRRATFDMREPSVALSLATHQLDDDGEEYDDRQTVSLAHSSVAVPESRPWHEWCAKAEKGRSSLTVSGVGQQCVITSGIASRSQQISNLIILWIQSFGMCFMMATNGGALLCDVGPKSVGIKCCSSVSACIFLQV